jgi:glucosamine kinase
MGRAEPFFLGVDGGGTGCRARIRDAAGRLVSEAAGGASNIYRDFDATLATLVATAEEAAAQAGLRLSTLHAGLGLAGMVTSVDASRLIAAKLPFASVVADNDAYAACLGAFSGGDGGIIVAGTGSIGMAIVAGARHMVGGWGFILGDQGSGAWLGQQAVRRAALAFDGQVPQSGLIAAILTHAGQTRQSLTRWSDTAEPKAYAALAPLIFEHAAGGDGHGLALVAEGAAAISALGQALRQRGARRLCLLGGLRQPYLPHLSPDVRGDLVDPAADAMDGAIMMARRGQGLPEWWT